MRHAFPSDIGPPIQKPSTFYFIGGTLGGSHFLPTNLVVREQLGNLSIQFVNNAAIVEPTFFSDTIKRPILVEQNPVGGITSIGVNKSIERGPRPSSRRGG